MAPTSALCTLSLFEIKPSHYSDTTSACEALEKLFHFLFEYADLMRVRYTCRKWRRLLRRVRCRVGARRPAGLHLLKRWSDGRTTRSGARSTLANEIQTGELLHWNHVRWNHIMTSLFTLCPQTLCTSGDSVWGTAFWLAGWSYSSTETSVALLLQLHVTSVFSLPYLPILFWCEEQQVKLQVLWDRLVTWS